MSTGSDIVTGIDELLNLLDLDCNNSPYSIDMNSGFSFRAPLSFVQCMKKGEWYDPLLLQIIPRMEEQEQKPGYTTDPVGDTQALKAPGLLHKYFGRVMLLVSGDCPIHCRFCFRRGYEYDLLPVKKDDWEQAFKYIKYHPEIFEVILSGGEPLYAGSRMLRFLFDRLSTISHIRQIRIHTRTPVVMPSLVDAEMVATLSEISSSHSCAIVLHCNHASELSIATKSAIGLLKTTGALLFNQSVLLKGVNDSVETIRNLSLLLIELGVIPYYLHQLDQVAGACHFRVMPEDGIDIMKKVSAQLPGYCVPGYVREEPGALGKTPMG